VFKGWFRLPSPALVLSMVALSLVLGGTAFAAVTARHKDARADRRLVKKLAPSLSVKHAMTADSATSAANATHATSAVSATSATNASHAVNSDELGGQLPSYYLPASAARRFGPIHVNPITEGESYTTLATLGQLTFAGDCFDNGTTEEVGLWVRTFADHAAYAAVSGNTDGGAASVRISPDTLNIGFYLLGAVVQSSGLRTFVPVTGEALSADGHQVFFNLYGGQNARGATGGKCVFGGSLVVS
jgi:hypothetical protein